MTVRIQTGPFDIAAEIAGLTNGRSDIGAVVSFTGHVRGAGEAGPLQSLTLEHYPGMTEREIERIEADAVARFQLVGSRVVHRVGTLQPGEAIVLVVAAAPHRHAAFEGASFLMDYLKSRAPFWKKEAGVDGAQSWVDARDSDAAALARWDGK